MLLVLLLVSEPSLDTLTSFKLHNSHTGFILTSAFYTPAGRLKEEHLSGLDSGGFNTWLEGTG